MHTYQTNSGEVTVMSWEEYQRKKNMTTTEEILKTAIAKYGKTAQIEMLIEECSEVIHAVQKRKRLMQPGETEDYHNKLIAVNDHLFEELADLSITLDQMFLIFPPQKIEAKREEKLLRLQIRLGMNKYKNIKPEIR